MPHTYFIENLNTIARTKLMIIVPEKPVETISKACLISVVVFEVIAYTGRGYRSSESNTTGLNI